MFRIDTDTAVASIPTPTAEGTPGYFANSVAGVSDATELDQDFFNSVQEEMIALLSVGESLGVTPTAPSKATTDQIKTHLENAIQLIGGGEGGGANTEDVVQAGHGFAKYDAIQHNGTIFVKSQADATENASVVGVVSAVADTDNFTVTYSGIIEWNAHPTVDYPLGNDIWLSTSSAGTILSTEPSYTEGQVRQYIGESVPSGLNVNIDIGIEIVTSPDPANSRGRLVKFLTTSGTLTINEDADDTIEAYLTSNEIKSGNYLVYAYGAGGGGGGATYGSAGPEGAHGGGGGGISMGILEISSSTSYTIGAGGTGGVGKSGDGTGGGGTNIGIHIGGGGGGGEGNDKNNSSYVSVVSNGGIGGTGTFKTGISGGRGHYANGSGGGTGGAYQTPFNGTGVDGGLSGGGAGGLAIADYTTGTGGDGGDGYIEIYEWSI